MALSLLRGGDRVHWAHVHTDHVCPAAERGTKGQTNNYAHHHETLTAVKQHDRSGVVRCLAPRRVPRGAATAHQEASAELPRPSENAVGYRRRLLGGSRAL